MTYIHAQCASVRAEMTLLQTKLHDVEAEKQLYHERLIAAEQKLDRLQSRAVSALNPASWTSDEDSRTPKVEAGETVKAESAEPGQSTHSSPKPPVRLSLV